MPAQLKKTILLDTNCFLRIYESPALPVLGVEFDRFRVLTLDKLIREFLDHPRLVSQYPRTAASPKVDDLKKGALKLSKPKQKLVDNEKSELRAYARALIGSYIAKQLDYSHLSPNDLELLATVVVLRGVIATDERALTLVAQKLTEEAPDEYDIAVMSSMEVLALYENNGALTREQRRATVRWWMKDGQKLPTNWRAQYQELFGESSDDLDD